MIVYRDATRDDGAVLGGIARATFIQAFGDLYALPDLEAFLAEGSDAAYAAELADPDIEVRFATSGGAPIGFVKISGLQLPAPTQGRRGIELRQLYVYKPWHGGGIAQALTDWAFARARARGGEDLWLTVYTENHRGRRFYARNGFVEIEPYRFMVGAQADEDILCRATL